MKTLDKWPIKTIEQINFPEHLKRIKNCPKFLNYRGNWDNNIFEKSIAIVGSRRMSQYGKSVIEKFVPELVVHKFTVISGFMYGVDTAAHNETVECGGITVAVLGGGLNVFTPAENEKLYWEILNKGGLIISEYENDFLPTRWSFPQRDRLLAGLSHDGVLVIEATMMSGSLITARLCQEQGKKLYAVPGPINYSLSIGVNYLIKEKGATMATCPEDITNKKTSFDQLSFAIVDPLEKLIMENLSIESLTTDELAKKLNKNISLVMQKLMIMNMENKVTENLGKWGRL
ncbi:MAG: DNA-processing protein DprA [Candidatus Shapirobacteria bacterium]